jgi:hypothetical protein
VVCLNISFSICLYELDCFMYEFLCLLSIHEYAYHVVISLLLMGDAWKKKSSLLCAKFGIVMPLLIFKIQCTN